MDPGEWSYVRIGDTEMLILSCPKCLGQWTDDRESVDERGNIVRPIKCPYAACGTTFDGMLEDWTP